MSSELPFLDISSEAHPTAALIVLHGLGADGHDFLSVCQALSPPCAMRFILPHAPVRPVSVNNGYPMRAWYDIVRFSQTHANQEDEEGIRSSQKAIEQLIERLDREEGIPPERVGMMGFSQGCAMTWQVGLRYPRRLAGLAGLSGYLALPDSFQREKRQPSDVPILMAHGTQDEVIPLAWAKTASTAIESAGYSVGWWQHDAGHTVPPGLLKEINLWMQEAFSESAEGLSSQVG